jgi:hypothetical protein
MADPRHPKPETDKIEVNRPCIACGSEGIDRELYQPRFFPDRGYQGDFILRRRGCGLMPREMLNPAVDRLDLIVAFDVFEHMTVEEILDFLRLAASLLNPGGRLLPGGRHYPHDGPFDRPPSIDGAFRGARPPRRLQRCAAARRHCTQGACAEGALNRVRN